MTSSLSAQPSLKRGKKSFIIQKQETCFENVTSQRQASTPGNKQFRRNVMAYLKFRLSGKEESTVIQTRNEQSDWLHAKPSLTHLKWRGFSLVPLESFLGIASSVIFLWLNLFALFRLSCEGRMKELTSMERKLNQDPGCFAEEIWTCMDCTPRRVIEIKHKVRNILCWRRIEYSIYQEYLIKLNKLRRKPHAILILYRDVIMFFLFFFLSFLLFVIIIIINNGFQFYFSVYSLRDIPQNLKIKHFLENIIPWNICFNRFEQKSILLNIWVLVSSFN